MVRQTGRQADTDRMWVFWEITRSEVIIIKLPVFESVNFRFVLWRLLGKRNCRVDDSNDYYKTPRFRFVSYS